MSFVSIAHARLVLVLKNHVATFSATPDFAIAIDTNPSSRKTAAW
jgi:hypothetical protein